MKRSTVAHLNCSIARTLEIVGEWWTLLVVHDVALGFHRFDDIQRDLGISRNILSDRLATLVEHDILERRQYQDSPPRFEYHLTAKGHDLWPVLAGFALGRPLGEPRGSAGPLRPQALRSRHRGPERLPRLRPAGRPPRGQAPQGSRVEASVGDERHLITRHPAA